MAWGSERRGHGVPNEVSPFERAQQRDKAARRASADIHMGWRGAGGGWRKLCWDRVHFLNKTKARLAAVGKGGEEEVLGMTRERDVEWSFKEVMESTREVY